MRISAHNLKIETGRFYNLDRHESRVVYGIGAIKRNVKNVAVFPPRYYVENTKITPSTRLDILLRNRK